MKASTEKENKEKKITRHVFRLPLNEDSNVSVSIEGESFQAINIVENGIGILVDAEAAFSAGQKFKSIDLNLDGEILYLQGTVVHLSPRDFQLICGIRFTKLGQKDKNKILHFLETNKHKLFGT